MALPRQGLDAALKRVLHILSTRVGVDDRRVVRAWLAFVAATKHGRPVAKCMTLRKPLTQRLYEAIDVSKRS